jgi:mxaJ protein
VFVSRRDRNLHITALDDPKLLHLRIGVHVLGDQDSSLPPVHALVRRNLAHNLVGFSIFGNLAESNPSADLIEAVSKNQVDIAVTWGPLAGYFARQSAVPLEITPISDDPLDPGSASHFSNCYGVRQGDTHLRDVLNAELKRCEPEIQDLRRSYGIPQLGLASSSAGE